MQAKVTLLLLSLPLFFVFCKSSKFADAPKPPESYTPYDDRPPVSNITVPINIPVDDLVKRLNSSVNGVLYEDNSYDDNNKDNLKLRVTKSKDFTLFLSGQTIKYRVPLKLWFKQNLYLGAAEGEGELALNFKTTFSVREDWSLATQTEVEYHEWLSKPVLKTGLGDLNIESIANIVLNRSKRTLSQTIDRVVSQQLTLKPYVQEVWNALQDPTLLSEEYQMWVKTTPLSIGMTPITTDWSTIRAKIAVGCLNDVSFGAKPAFRPNSSLPNLTHLDPNHVPDDFELHFAVDVPFPEAERLARGMMVGQEFASGKRKVRVDDIRLWGNNDKIVVNSKLSGSFNGNIYFIGKPVYNPQKNQIEVADLDFHVDTRNVLLRSASWLFQGPIRRQMQSAMTFPLDENIGELKKSVQETLQRYELQPGVILSGRLDSVAVENTHITPSSIRVNLYSKGAVAVDVRE